MNAAKRPLQAGDRVRVYCTRGHWDGDYVGKVLKSTDADDEMIVVKSADGRHWHQHAKQCRRLRPRASKAEEERVAVPRQIFLWLRSAEVARLKGDRQEAVDSAAKWMRDHDAQLKELAAQDEKIARLLEILRDAVNAHDEGDTVAMAHIMMDSRAALRAQAADAGGEKDA